MSKFTSGNFEPDTSKVKSDEEILEDFRISKDPNILETLIVRYQKDLYGYLYRYLGDAQMAEDVFQATFLQIYLKSEEHFDPGRKFRPWLYTVAMNQAIDAQRRNKRHQHASLQKSVYYSEDMDSVSLLEVLPGKDGTPEEGAIIRERAEKIRDFIDTLPSHLRDVILLIYYESIKYREAAEILNLPVGTVKSRLHTAMKRLAAWLYDRKREDEL
ncbi:MAG: RNA polymerase sigma factor [Planctomycetia bacterium]|nr:RNA polymerase sigma factor [Planctomycetia bacterium]